MVRVAFAIWPYPSHPKRLRWPGTAVASLPYPAPRPMPIACASGIPRSKRRASLAGGPAPILHGNRGRGVPDEVDVISGLSEPYGPDGTMAEGSGIGPEVPQSGSAGGIRQD